MRAGKRHLSAVALIAVALLAPRGSVDASPFGAQDQGTDTTGARQGAEPRRLPAGDFVVSLDDLSRPLLLENQLAALAGVPREQLGVTVPGGAAHLGDLSLGRSDPAAGHLLVLYGTAEIAGRVNGNVVAVDGDVVLRDGAVVTGDVLALRGVVRDLGGEVTGEIRSLSAPLTLAPGGNAVPARARPLGTGERVVRAVAGTGGALLSLAVLGFLLSLFGRANLEVVSETVTHSFGRAFVTGVLGQLLLLPTFGMIVAGLILSVVGILLLPFAVIVFALLAFVGIVGGFLAVATAMGETWTRRRMAQGARLQHGGVLRYLLTGLAAVAALWLAWSLLGWVPFAGGLMLVSALIVTWMMATVGFGAALLSRAGARENFAGRILPPEALTDEYLWATPQFGVPAVRRPGSGGGGGTSTRTPPPLE